MKVKVIHNDGTEVEATVGPRVQVEVERRYDVLFSWIFDETSGKARVEHFYFVALAALKFAGHDSVKDVDLADEAAFEEWLGTVEDVVPVAEGARRSTRPTKKAAKRASSSG